MQPSKPLDPQTAEMRARITPALERLEMNYSTINPQRLLTAESERQLLAHAIGQPELLNDPDRFRLETSNLGKFDLFIAITGMEGQIINEDIRRLGTTLGVPAIRENGKTWLSAYQLGSKLRNLGENIASAPDQEAKGRAIGSFWAQRDQEMQHESTDARGRPQPGKQGAQ